MAVLLAHQAVTHPNTIVGTTVNVGRFDEAQVECYHGFDEAAANTNPASFLIQTSLSDSGNEDWVTIVEFTVANGTPTTQVFLANEPIDETLMEVTDASISAAGDLIYIRDTVAANSEWALVQEVDTVIPEFIVLVDGIARAHAITTTAIFTDAEKFPVRINVKAALRVRAVYQNEGGAAANTHIKAEIVLIETGN